MIGTGRVAVATTSELAADAAAEMAAAGGNAVDCAIAASLVTMNTQPGVCSLAGGAYVTIWRSGEAPVTIDGGAAIPGKDLDDDYRPDQGERVRMAYGGGMETVVGCASVAVPGAVAACDTAIRRFGRLDLGQALGPSIRAARDGFPLPANCHYYLRYAGEPIYYRSEDGSKALYTDDGEVRPTGSSIVIPHLADSLAAIASEGAALMYEGELATRIVAHVKAGGGALTCKDLASYRPIERPALRVPLGDWELAVNPPPAIGGAILAAMLLGVSDSTDDPQSPAAIARLIRVQHAALRYRVAELDLADDVGPAVAELLALAASGELLSRHRSAATVHTSAVDSQGLGCAITASAGYGCGEMPAETGLWLNNSMGELELNMRGFDAGPPGARLPSNMAPGVARTDDTVLAFGSPGADRITTALQQFLVNHLLRGMSLDDANAAPRLHVEHAADPPAVSSEKGIDVPDIGLPVRYLQPMSMYFGGVGAARFDAMSGLSASADPRRAGGVFVVD